MPTLRISREDRRLTQENAIDGRLESSLPARLEGDTSKLSKSVHRTTTWNNLLERDIGMKILWALLTNASGWRGTRISFGFTVFRWEQSGEIYWTESNMQWTIVHRGHSLSGRNTVHSHEGLSSCSPEWSQLHCTKHSIIVDWYWSKRFVQILVVADRHSNHWSSDFGCQTRLPVPSDRYSLDF